MTAPSYFAAQPALEARLREVLPPGVPLRIATDFAQAKDQAIGSREVWLLFHSDEVRDTAETETLLEQRWMVVYFTPGSIPDPARDGEVLSAITKGLSGWYPGEDSLSEVKRTGSMVPMSFDKDDLVGFGQLFSVHVSL